MQPGFERIEDDELVYRRIRLELHDETKSPHPSPFAFRPQRLDTNGISLWRARYVSPEQAAAGRPGKRYWVAHLSVRDIQSLGLTLRPDDPADPAPIPGHCVIPELTHAVRREDQPESWQVQLARKTLRVDGPFP